MAIHSSTQNYVNSSAFQMEARKQISNIFTTHAYRTLSGMFSTLGCHVFIARYFPGSRRFSRPAKSGIDARCLRHHRLGGFSAICCKAGWLLNHTVSGAQSGQHASWLSPWPLPRIFGRWQSLFVTFKSPFCGCGKQRMDDGGQYGNVLPNAARSAPNMQTGAA